MTAALAFSKAGEGSGGLLKSNVDNYSVAGRLKRLAPLHQRAAVSRAMHLAGMRGMEKPSLATLHAAENPPAADWHSISHPFPAAEAVEAQARRLIGTAAWKGEQDKLASPEAQLRQAVHKTTVELIRQMKAEPQAEMVNRPAFEAGERLAAKWKPVLAVLGEMLDMADELIDDLHLAAVPEDELRNMAQERARAGIRRLYPQYQTQIEDRNWQALAECDDFDPTPDEKREMGQRAHLRRLRKQAKAARQHAAAIFGTVGHKDAPYVDTYSHQRWKEREEANARYAEGQVLVTEDGRAIPMTSVLKKKKSASSAQFYVMCKAMDEHAARQGWAGVYVTVTLPTEFHPNPRGNKAGYNPGNSPKRADQELQHRLARMRARMARKDMPTFGIRVFEPHRDGCPHAHLMLYMPEGDIERLDAMLLDLFPEATPGQRVASRCVRIDTEMSAAPSYLVKHLVSDEDRVRAWASERGLRRWAMWGTHGIQRVWQCLYQRKQLPTDAPQQVTDANAAIKTRRYADALDALGAVRGCVTPRVRLAYEEVETAYGEIRKAPIGITVEGTGWVMPLKERQSQVMSRGDWEYDAVIARTVEHSRRVDAWRAALAAGKQAIHPAAVTVVVSNPSGAGLDGADGGGTGRTGPPGVVDPAKGRDMRKTEPEALHRKAAMGFSSYLADK